MLLAPFLSSAPGLPPSLTSTGQSGDGPRHFIFLGESSGLIAGCGPAIDAGALPVAHGEGQCSGHGICMRDSLHADQGTCACTAPWKGRHCDYIECPSYGLLECAGRGRCRLDGVSTACVCDPGFAGADCGLVLACDPWASGLPCHGRGECTANNTCGCEEGYDGDLCSNDLLCPTDEMGRPCGGNGVCVAHRCLCEERFFGATCDDMDTSVVERPEPPSINKTAIAARARRESSAATAWLTARRSTREPRRLVPQRPWPVPAAELAKGSAVEVSAAPTRGHGPTGPASRADGVERRPRIEGVERGPRAVGVERSRTSMPGVAG